LTGDVPIGEITRGTTNTNRLRRVDRWIATLPVLRSTPDPLVVDLGYGASGITAFELHDRLSVVRPDLETIGFEIAPDRVATAQAQLAGIRAGQSRFAPDILVSFARGGFEVPLPRNRQATVIRAFNVLRQYNEADVPGAWELMVARLQPRGVVVEGTCNEIGRVASWVAITAAGPQTLTISLRLTGLEAPSVVAERLPKALIHRNVPGERIHKLLSDLDRAWQHNAGLGVYGARQRFIASVAALRADGWSVLGGPARVRLGELTVPWSEVAPSEH
jgi:hypothetical protein